MKTLLSGPKATLTRYGILLAFLAGLALYSAVYYSIVERGIIWPTKDPDAIYEVPPYYEANVEKVFLPIHVADRKLIRKSYWTLPPKDHEDLRRNQLIDAGIHFCLVTNAYIQVSIMHDQTGGSEYMISTEEGCREMARWLEANRLILLNSIGKKYVADQPAAAINIVNRHWRAPGRYNGHCQMFLTMDPPGQDLLNLLEAHGSLHIK